MKIPRLRKNPDGRAFVEIPGAGRKRKYFGKYGTPEANEAYSEWIRLWIDGAMPKQEARPTAELVPIYLAYLKHMKGRVSRQTFDQAKVASRKFFEYVGTSIKVSDLTPALLRGFQTHLSKQTYREGGVDIQFSRVYCNDLVKRFKRFIRWAMGEGSIDTDTALRLDAVEPLKRGKSEARETRKVTAVSWADVQRTLPFFTPTIATMVQVQFLCGMRPGEVCGMKRADIDRKGVMVEGVRIWLYAPEEHKGAWRGQELEKAIPPLAQEMLTKWEQRGDCGDYFFSPRQATKDAYGWNGPWVVGEKAEWDKTLTKLAECYKTTIYDAAVKAGVERAVGVVADLRPWTPNQLRHGMATLLRATPGIGIEGASAYAGHRNIDTTLIYAHRTREQIARIAAQFGNILEK